MKKDRTFQDLSPSKRMYYFGVLVVLSLGYFFALLYTLESHGGKDGIKGLSPEDIKIAYRGNGKKSTLESALSEGGIMANNLLPLERDIILQWAKEGADKEKYAAHIDGVIKSRCLFCHDGSTNSVALSSYENITALMVKDTGTSEHSLMKVSHIHLFGLAFIFYIVNRIFIHVDMNEKRKSLLIALPFAVIIIDIISWWLTKFYLPLFAYVVYVSGAIMALSFGFQVVISMYQTVFKGAD